MRKANSKICRLFSENKILFQWCSKEGGHLHALELYNYCRDLTSHLLKFGKI